jgi:hypothetical protein
MLPHKSKGHLAQRRSNLLGIIIISMAAAIIFFGLGYLVGHEDAQFRLLRAKAMSLISFIMTLVISWRVCKKFFVIQSVRRMPSVVFAYSFGKAQRILSGLDASIGPIVCHVFEAFGFVDPPNVNLPRGNYKAEKRYAAQTGERAVFLSIADIVTTNVISSTREKACRPLAAHWSKCRKHRGHE